MFALLLKSQGLHHKKICETLGICHDTLTDYCRAYQSGGIEDLKALNFYRPKSQLEEYRDTIEEAL
jgi:transposase